MATTEHKHSASKRHQGLSARAAAVIGHATNPLDWDIVALAWQQIKLNREFQRHLKGFATSASVPVEHHHMAAMYGVRRQERLLQIQVEALS